MTDSLHITLVLEGLADEDGHVRLAAFISELQSLSATLQRIDRDGNGGEAGSRLRIVELSYNSPIRVVVEAQSIKKYPGSTNRLADNLGNIVSVFENDGDLLSIESDVLEDFRNMARPVGRSIKAAALFFSGQRLELTREIFDRVDRALAVADECEGAMQGMLEQINIHGGANLFHIFPEIGPSKIACSFPSRLYDDAVSSVGRMVEVQGTLKFRARASFPHQISVSCIETFPPEDALPSWDDIRGRAPDCTDGMSSEEYVRSLRNAWR